MKETGSESSFIGYRVFSVLCRNKIKLTFSEIILNKLINMINVIISTGKKKKKKKE